MFDEATVTRKIEEGKVGGPQVEVSITVTDADDESARELADDLAQAIHGELGDDDETGALVERVADWHVQLWEDDDGNLRIYIHDHTQIAVEGTHKDKPTVVVGEEEFPAEFLHLTEQEFWERYHE